jgi:hypothetical protein
VGPSEPASPEPVRAEPVPDPATTAFASAAPALPRAPIRNVGWGRRTRAEIRKIDPWSVLKFSLIFYFCVMLVVWVALLLIYMVLSAAGAVDSLARLLGYLFSSGPSVSTKGPTPVKIDSLAVFIYLFFACCAFTVIWSLINVVIAFIYNLISDVVGGIEITLADRNR